MSDPKRLRNIRTTDAQWAAWDSAAKAEGLTRSEWVRRRLDSAAFTQPLEMAPYREAGPCECNQLATCEKHRAGDAAASGRALRATFNTESGE